MEKLQRLGKINWKDLIKSRNNDVEGEGVNHALLIDHVSNLITKVDHD